MSKIILITSGKGGTGKTMFSVNMGATLAQYGFSVMLVDMDMGLRNMDLYLGMENKVVYNIMDVMSGVCRINKAMIKVDGFDSLYFMAASPGKDERDITPLHMKVLCDKLSGIFDFIIIDTPAGLGDVLDIAMAPAQAAVIITEPEIAPLRDADTTERYLIKNGISETYMILNKVKFELMKEGLLPDLNSIKNIFDGPIAGIIQYDDNIHISTNRGTPIVSKQGTYIEANFRDIVKRIVT